MTLTKLFTRASEGLTTPEVASISATGTSVGNLNSGSQKSVKPRRRCHLLVRVL